MNCPECNWEMVVDDDGEYCERCSGENDPSVDPGLCQVNGTWARYSFSVEDY